ncbi:MAG: NADH-quinone oxidoreductase subunit J [Alphaproteobacteria bacterium]|nr:NADH-quinone oxidoreductase subunit J [Alphaproteobacteria bacterium]MBE8220069.1 NADH-quinone oxidoreductase subunit J [Alphaproteobacteria bacterium]
MILPSTIIFYMLAGVSVASAFMVIASRNPIYSIFFLILTFVQAAGLFILLHAEFLALLLVVVYVGAVAVLFLFVVMMLDIDFSTLREGVLQYMPIGATVGVILLCELIFVFASSSEWAGANKIATSITTSDITNTEAIGRVLYTDYIYYFQLAGVILLVAMIGAIVLTLVEYDNPRRQNIAAQNARRPEDAIELIDIKPQDKEDTL